MPVRNHFAGIANANKLKARYRELSKKLHPDVNKATDAESQFKDMKAEFERVEKEGVFPIPRYGEYRDHGQRGSAGFQDPYNDNSFANARSYQQPRNHFHDQQQRANDAYERAKAKREESNSLKFRFDQAMRKYEVLSRAYYELTKKPWRVKVFNHKQIAFLFDEITALQIAISNLELKDQQNLYRGHSYHTPKNNPDDFARIPQAKEKYTQVARERLAIQLMDSKEEYRQLTNKVWEDKPSLRNYELVNEITKIKNAIFAYENETKEEALKQQAILNLESAISYYNTVPGGKLAKVNNYHELSLAELNKTTKEVLAAIDKKIKEANNQSISKPEDFTIEDAEAYLESKGGFFNIIKKKFFQ